GEEFNLSLLVDGYWRYSYSTCVGNSDAVVGPCFCWLQPSVPGRDSMIQIVAKRVPNLAEEKLISYFAHDSRPMIEK
ncbi:MAG: hypothetical protein AAFU67_18805, partial [Bacteroidota bacterium]